MQEHLAFDAEERIIVEAPGPKPVHIRIARHVSNILAPATISLPFVFLVAFNQAHAVCLVDTYTDHPGKYPDYCSDLSHPEQFGTLEPGLLDRPGRN